MNRTPFVRQYGILTTNEWGVVICQEKNQTRDIQGNSNKKLLKQ